MAVNEGTGDYLGRDMHACEYFKGGWKMKKDAIMSSDRESLIIEK